MRFRWLSERLMFKLFPHQKSPVISTLRDQSVFLQRVGVQSPNLSAGEYLFLHRRIDGNSTQFHLSARPVRESFVTVLVHTVQLHQFASSAATVLWMNEKLKDRHQ
jgi:hypothetical protein